MAPFWSFSSSSRGPSHAARPMASTAAGNRRQGEQQHRAGEQVGD